MNYIFIYSLSIFLITFISCNSRKLIVADEETFLINKTDTIYLYKSSINNILEMNLGKFTVKDWNGFSYEYEFRKNGLSFTYKQSDSTRTIRWISVDPRKCSTSIMGMMELNNQTQIKDIVQVFGRGDWVYTSDLSELTLDYDFMDVEVTIDSNLLASEVDPLDEIDWHKYLHHYKNTTPTNVTFY